MLDVEKRMLSFIENRVFPLWEKAKVFYTALFLLRFSRWKTNLRLVFVYFLMEWL